MDEKRWSYLAENYHDTIVSPFQKNVKNPLKQELLKLKNRKNKIVAEYGCGRLEYGEFLANNFKKTFAFDFSEKMVEMAKGNNNFSNIEIEQLDLTKLKIKNEFDVAISVNSIIMPSLKDIKTSLKNIHSSLKKEGSFFLIIPSMESVLYYNMLVINKEINKNINKKNEKKAIKDAIKISETKNYDYFLGLYRDVKDIQKLYYEHEIYFLLNKAGFKDIKFQKVEYPWEKGISTYENFPKEKPLWDWFITCHK